jgi:hypothetical protein
VRLISRPFLVSQEFGDGAFYAHMINELTKVVTFRSLRLEAHPNIMPKPFSGVHIINLLVRPPSPRNAPGDQLVVTCHFTVRPGSAVQVYNAGTDTVGIAVVLNDLDYIQPPFPRRNDWNLSLSDIGQLDPDIGKWLTFGEIVGLLTDPIAAAIVARGILTDRYDAPRASSVHDLENVVSGIPLQALRPGAGVSLGEDQPFRPRVAC